MSRSVLPERYFARELVKTHEYSFIRADDVLDIQTAKSLPEQRSTAIRMRYPQVHRRPELVLIMTSAISFLLLGPFLIVLAGFFWDLGTAFWLAAASAAVIVATHVLIVAVSNPPNIPIACVNLPIVIITELVLGIESMLKYEFSEVHWKDRNICIPVMHVTPHLPRI